MALIDKVKRDFARHKQKAIVLAVLAVVMLGFVAKAYFDMAPRAAKADPSAVTASPNGGNAAARTPDSEETIKQSKLLWKTLRDKRGVAPAAAFAFEPTFFNLNPNRKQVPDQAELTEVAPKPSVVNEKEAELARKKAQVLAASRNLVVKSTVVGSGRPVAVVNDQTIAASDRILGIGDRISNFKITAIRAREVEFEKDGITVAVEMARNPGTK